jgi:two-component system sensor histidine kinase and response regulator WspE
MMDLFRMEADTQTAILSEALLELEQDPSRLDRVEELMRAAHSLKGAARIVNLDPVVELTHKMEDRFVEVQEGRLSLNGGDVDLFLECLDFLKEISTWSDSEATDKTTEAQSIVNDLAKRLDLVGKGEIAKTATASPSSTEPDLASANETETPPNLAEDQSLEAAPSDPPQPKTPTKSSETPTSNQDGFVRVTAKNLNRLMELAAESLVESRQLSESAANLGALRSIHHSLDGALTQLKSALSSMGVDESTDFALSEVRQHASIASQRISEHIDRFEAYLRRNGRLADNLYQESLSSRMRPFGEGLGAYPRMIRDISKSLGKKARLEIKGKETKVDRDVLEKLDAPLSHILRNALDHGLEKPEERLSQGKPEIGSVTIEARHHAGSLRITIRDDGRGVGIDRLRQKVISKKLTSQEVAEGLTKDELLGFLFLPAFSTTDQVTEISGRGVGLDVVQSLMQDLGGIVRIETEAGAGTSFHLQLPITRSVIRALLMEISGELYATPISRVERVCIIPESETHSIENRKYMTLDEQEVGLISAEQILNIVSTRKSAENLSVIVLDHKSKLYGLVVDRFCGERELVVRPLDSRLGKVPNINAAAVHEDGTPILILDIDDLVHSIDNRLSGDQWQSAIAMTPTDANSSSKRKSVLVVDDSISVRQLQKQILESNGYQVHLAVDGVEGWNATRLGTYDLIVSDVDMPRMTGLELVEHIRNEPRFASLPVIIVSYKDREEDRRRGLEVGANFYLTKSSFQDDTYLNAIIDLIGEGQK